MVGVIHSYTLFSCYDVNRLQLDKLVGLGMLVAASVVFLYYTIWTLLMVSLPFFILH